MTEPVFKLLLFLKRRPGLSMDEFQDHYENVHSKLAEKYSAGVLRYVRRYLQPFGPDADMEFDVITEIWFADRATCERVGKFTARGDLPADVIADEERLFDRAKSRQAMVVEYDSAIGGQRTIQPDELAPDA